MLACCKGWRRLVCVADNLNHRVRGRSDSAARVGILCDLHDRAIGLSWSEIRGGN